ncbi:MAG: histidine kinase, partial [Candidatus Eremiobacteraeota bacterium]|nr:histidine kinase [Candidatus Eremiobacteraeota bacterium]
VKTTLMSVSRAVIFPLAGLGHYDYGVMLYRYPMEAAKDVITFALIYGCVYVFARLERGRAAEVAAADLHAELAEARLENLRLQLNPHFLFNTLNAISAVMYEDVRKADRMLSKLSEFLRVVLESSGVQHVGLTEELRVEQMYVDIMGTRLERQLRMNFRIANDARDAEIPFMLLQPLLENSIRHGLRADRSELEIDIAAERSSGLLVIDVMDNGIGYAPSGRHGHGLRNVESRLQHTFGAASSFSIESRPGGGTHVRLSYPVASALPA